MITALKAGKATITAKSDDGGYVAECDVKVLKPVVENEEENGDEEDEDDSEIEEPESDTRIVSFTFKLPGAGTKSAEMMQLVYEIYRTEDSYAETFGENDQLVCHESIEFFGNNTSIDVEVKRDANYTALFWVQYEDNGIYDVTSLTNVTIPTELPSNTSDADALAGRGHIVADSYQTEYEVQLRRPISKLKVGCKSEFEEHTKIFKSCSQTISIDGLYTTYDVGQLRAKGSLSTIHLTESPTLGKEEDEYIIIGDNYLGFAGDGTDATAVVLNLIGFREFGTENIIPIGICKSTYMRISFTSNRYRVATSLYELGDSGTK